jgi:hypothetical protein
MIWRLGSEGWGGEDVIVNGKAVVRNRGCDPEQIRERNVGFIIELAT